MKGAAERLPLFYCLSLCSSLKLQDNQQLISDHCGLGDSLIGFQ